MYKNDTWNRLKQTTEGQSNPKSQKQGLLGREGQWSLSFPGLEEVVRVSHRHFYLLDFDRITFTCLALVELVSRVV